MASRFTEKQRRALAQDAQRRGPARSGYAGGDTIVGSRVGVPARKIADWRYEFKMYMDRGSSETPTFVVAGLSGAELAGRTAVLPERFLKDPDPDPPPAPAVAPAPGPTQASHRSAVLAPPRRPPAPAVAPAPGPTQASHRSAVLAPPGRQAARSVAPAPATAPASAAAPSAGDGDDARAIRRWRESDGARTQLPDPPRYLSPLGASTFERCPRRWRYQHVDGYEPVPSRAEQVGVFAQRVIERCMDEPPETRTIDQARQFAKESWAMIENSEEFAALDLNPHQTKQFKWRAWSAIEGLWDIEDPTGVAVEGTDLDITVNLGGVPFRGIVNRAERTSEGLVVSDYKSGRMPPWRFMGRTRQQAMLYAAAVGEYMGETPARVNVMYLGQQQVSTEVTQAKVDASVKRLARLWDSLKTACASDDFKTRPGKLCRSCPFLQVCEPGQAEVERLDTKE